MKPRLSFCTTPPCRMISSVLFLCATAVRCVEVKKELRSNLILYILQGRSRRFLYISNKGLYTLWGSTVCSSLSFFFALLLLLLCLFVNFFFKLLSRVFLVQEIFFDQTDGMGNKWNTIRGTVLDFSFWKTAPLSFRPGV